jgi:hypothetical protein
MCSRPTAWRNASPISRIDRQDLVARGRVLERRQAGI